MKQIYCMGGLPRSGSTLLTVLLNQNPQISASHNSELLTSIYNYILELPQLEPIKLNLHNVNYLDVAKQWPQAFYRSDPKPIIIDKNRKWGTPFSLTIADEVLDEVKIVLLYRPILEVLTSFIVLARQYPETNFIDRGMIQDDFLPRHYRDIDEARCDWLMRPNGVIDAAILALATSQKPEYKDKFHLVSYEALTTNSQETLSGIYRFLNLDDYQHSLNVIEPYDNPLDESVLGIPSLHYVRPTIERRSVNPEQILSSYTIGKYRNTLTSIGLS